MIGYLNDLIYVCAPAPLQIGVAKGILELKPDGVRYCVDGPVETPGGDRPAIRTVWIVEKGLTEPRLVTAYPI